MMAVERIKAKPIAPSSSQAGSKKDAYASAILQTVQSTNSHFSNVASHATISPEAGTVSEKIRKILERTEASQKALTSKITSINRVDLIVSKNVSCHLKTKIPRKSSAHPVKLGSNEPSHATEACAGMPMD